MATVYTTREQSIDIFLSPWPNRSRRPFSVYFTTPHSKGGSSYTQYEEDRLSLTIFLNDIPLPSLTHFFAAMGRPNGGTMSHSGETSHTKANFHSPCVPCHGGRDILVIGYLYVADRSPAKASSAGKKLGSLALKDLCKHGEPISFGHQWTCPVTLTALWPHLRSNVLVSE